MHQSQAEFVHRLPCVLLGHLVVAFNGGRISRENRGNLGEVDGRCELTEEEWLIHFA